MEDINKNANKEHTKPTKTLEKVENTIKPTKTKTPKVEKQPNPVTIKIEISYQNYIQIHFDLHYTVLGYYLYS